MPNLRFLPLLLVFLGVMVLFNLWAMPKGSTKTIPYSEFRDLLAKGQLTEVVLEDRVVRAEGTPTATGEAPRYVAVRVDDPELVEDLRAAGVKFSGHVTPTFWRDLASWVVPILILVLIWSFVFRRMAGGQAGLGGAMGFGRTRARLASPEEVKETFRDVAGVDEAKAELEEIVAYLRTPERFRRLGGKIPKGVLLVGPPGTGKTLLARAVAGEARVSFFSLSGSEFVEMFVGVGAARVRDLFAKAKEHAPCIIFIDELDAIGKARGIGGALSGHDEREQTLNQLLAEMDGFEANTGVILMAATNRPEILDPALLRPGRFDRQVLVDRPDLSGRRAILDVHVGNIKLAPEVDLDRVAQQTPGLVGADLANIVNEAALLAARHDHEAVAMADFQEAIERVLVGLEKKSRIMRPEERRRIAYHESGHALVGELVETGDPVLKISIIPRGMSALGHTLQMPTEDRYLMTRAELVDKLTTLLGGRAAEELAFGEVSTGAQNDLQRAADIARSMVLEFGMSERFGPVAFERERRPLFLDTGQFGSSREFSERTAEAIDEEIAQLVRGAHERALSLLSDNRGLLEKIARTLLEVEMIDRTRLLELMGRSDEAPAGGGADPSA